MSGKLLGGLDNAIRDAIEDFNAASYQPAEHEAVSYLRELIANQEAQIEELKKQKDAAEKQAEAAEKSARSSKRWAIASAVIAGLMLLLELAKCLLPLLLH